MTILIGLLFVRRGGSLDIGGKKKSMLRRKGKIEETKRKQLVFRPDLHLRMSARTSRPDKG